MSTGTKQNSRKYFNFTSMDLNRIIRPLEMIQLDTLYPLIQILKLYFKMSQLSADIQKK
jgi:hypothetical protein